MKAILRKLKKNLVTTKYYWHDARRFLRNASYGSAKLTENQLAARITAHAHCIEKGLALPEPRLGFGESMILSLVRLLSLYDEKGFSIDATCRKMAIGALKAYVEFHATSKHEITSVANAIDSLDLRNRSESSGGTTHITSAEILSKCNAAFSELVHSRYSVRKYSPNPVSQELIDRAIEIAQRSPSVCNRQGARVHVLETESTRLKALSHQNGNRGFGETANLILMVTVDLQIFHDISERNQAYIDGGMFAMSLVYALTSLGLASCCLNWSAKMSNDIAIREMKLVPDNEVIIMMISVGHYADEFLVAQSPRLPLDNIVVRH